MNMRVQASYAMPHSGLARCRELVRGAGRAARLFLALCVALLAVQAVFAIHQIDGDARLPAVALLAGITALLLISFARQLLRLRRAVALLEDMTEEMASAVTAAEARNRANSEFMATIGHEIRTPLNAILGMAELLSHARLGMQERSHVDVITSSGTTLLEMLNDILDFAKTEHGSMSTETVAFDVRSLAADAMRIVEGRARERFNRTAMHVEGLPETCWYRGDPTLIKRVLLNLLSNAVKFTEKGDVTVRISEARAGSFLRFDVTDTGIGIPEEARTRLFTAFSQADGSIGRRFGGTGLGLVICKRIVTLMGGSIGYESIPGRGSRFWFEIPAVRTEPADGASVQPAFDLGQSLPALRVLVVEDHPVNRQVAEQFLLMLGQKVAFASDGAEGVAMAADGNFDLILMDMEMPVMDGIAATRAIRGSGNKVKIVAMTANASDEDRARCAEAGMDGFAVKPVSLRRLSALIAGAGAGSGALAAVAGPEQQGQVWNEERLNELCAAVGEDGMRDLLRLFHADVPPALADLSRAVAARDAAAVDRTLHALKGAAANLGLAAVAALAESLRRAEIDRSMPDRLAAEIGRAGIIPDIKKAA